MASGQKEFQEQDSQLYLSTRPLSALDPRLWLNVVGQDHYGHYQPTSMYATRLTTPVCEEASKPLLSPLHLERQPTSVLSSLRPSFSNPTSLTVVSYLLTLYQVSIL